MNTGAYIDGRALYETARDLGFDVDYRKLKQWLDGQGALVDLVYVTRWDPNQVLSSTSMVRPLFQHLKQEGYEIVEHPDPSLGSVAPETTVWASSRMSAIDHLVLFARSADFLPLVRDAQSKGVSVMLISSSIVSSNPVDAGLKGAASAFVEMQDIQALIKR